MELFAIRAGSWAHDFGACLVPIVVVGHQLIFAVSRGVVLTKKLSADGFRDGFKSDVVFCSKEQRVLIRYGNNDGYLLIISAPMRLLAPSVDPSFS